MLLFHALLTEDLERFRSLLRGEQESSQAKFTKARGLKVDVNATDHLGRTVLHLIATEGKIEFLTVLLESVGLDISKPDRESGWTALHRALYAGQIAVTRLLLEYRGPRSSVQNEITHRTDLEHNTAFDLYNSTIPGVNPPPYRDVDGGSDLFTFGSNANHNLGFSDADDRTFPERVMLKRRKEESSTASRFRELRIRDVVISKYHTVVLTTDPVSNLYTCGFAKNGRLGSPGGTRFTLQPVDIPGQVCCIAAAQDHSLAVTKTGDLYAWGSNMYGQLGYDLETGATFSEVPRKVVKLVKETVLGVAVSTNHSVCFTATALYTWGRNDGALGYEINPQEGNMVRQPRKVTSLVAAVSQVTATRHATVCLLVTDDVLVFTNYGYFKLALQLDRFASQYQVFRPKQAYAPSKTVKVASGNTIVAVMTNMGDVFSFALDDSTSTAKPISLAKTIKPSRVWSLRKQHLAIRDVDIGQDDTIIMCTEGGSLYTGSRRSTKRKADSLKADYKFSRVSGMTRVVQVRASEGGAYGVIRNDAQLAPIDLDATNLSEDLLCILPYSYLILEEEELVVESVVDREDRDSDSDHVVPQHVRNMCDLLRAPELKSTWEYDEDAFDLIFQVGEQILPAHKSVCFARCPALRAFVLQDKAIQGFSMQNQQDHVASIQLDEKAFDLASLVLVVHWLYTDIILTPWVGCLSRDARQLLVTKERARTLATKLQLKPLMTALAGSFMVAPKPSLAEDMARLLASPGESGTADMRLMLEDGELLTHSRILAARSEFFDAMVAGAWINARRMDATDAVVEVNVKHISTRVMQVVLDHIFRDQDSAVFEHTSAKDVEDYLDLVVSVMAASAELLLPRLKQACQSVLARHVHRKNVVVILQEADRYSAEPLKEGCLDYCARNLHFLLENNFLANLPETLIHDLELYIARKQIERLPISKSGALLSQLIQRNPSVLEETELCRKRYLTSLLLPMNSLGPSDQGESTSLHRAGSNRELPKSKDNLPARSDALEEPSLMFEMEAYDLSEVATAIESIDFLADPVSNAPHESDIPDVSGRQEKPVPVRGWQPNASAASVTDLRSVLGQVSSSATSRGSTNEASWSPANSSSRSNQKERKKQQAATETASVSKLNGTSPKVASPWANRTSSPVTPLMTITRSQRQHAGSPSAERVTVSSSSGISVPQPTRRPSVTPKVSSYTNGSGSYGKGYPATSPTPSPAHVGPSLGEIIASEEDAKVRMVQYKAKRSMKEIQEQEAFEQWFQTESRRVQEEEAASAALALRLGSSPSRPKTKSRKGISKPKLPAATTAALDGTVGGPGPLPVEPKRAGTSSSPSSLPSPATGPAKSTPGTNPRASTFAPRANPPK